MAKMRIRRLEVQSMGKFMGIVGACCGPFVVLGVLGINLYRYGTAGGGAIAIILGLVSAMGVLAFWGICLGILVAFVFNLVSRWTGGIVVEVE